MCQLAINIPEEVLYDTKMTKDEAQDYVKQLIALNFYSKNKVSIGYCAQIAGMCEEDLYEEILIPEAVCNEVTAKTTAKFLGLNVTGTLGVLLKAKKLGIINKVKPIIDLPWLPLG